MSKKNIMEQMHDLIRTKGNTPIIWGYTRVSSLEQSLERQKIELEKYGVDFIVEEKASGKNFNRNVYKLLIENTRKGDKIICTSLDRFSRSVRETVKELELLEKKGVTVIFLKEKIDTSQTGISQLMLNIFSWVAEQERLTMLERQKKGYEALQKDEKGRLISKKGTIIGGKEKKFTNKQLELIRDYKQGKSIYNLSQLARLINVSRPTLYKKIKELTN